MTHRFNHILFYTHKFNSTSTTDTHADVSYYKIQQTINENGFPWRHFTATKSSHFHILNSREEWPTQGSVWPESQPAAGWSALCSKCAGWWIWWGSELASHLPWMRKTATGACWPGWAGTLTGQHAASNRGQRLFTEANQMKEDVTHHPQQWIIFHDTASDKCDLWF